MIRGRKLFGAGAVLLALVMSLTVAAAPANAGQTKISFYFGLKRPEAAARAAWAYVTDPGSADYRHFPTRDEIRSEFGASQSTVNQLTKFTRSHGLGFWVDPSGVYSRISGTPNQLSRIFKVKIKRDNIDGPPTWGWAAKSRPKVPRQIQPLIRETVPMFNRTRAANSKRSGADPSLTRAASSDKPKNEGTWTGGGAAAKKTGSYSYDQVRHAYGIDSLGDGSDASVAILNAGEGLDKATINTAAKCFGQPALNSQTLLTDGQTSAFPLGTFEPSIDLNLVRGMAPDIGKLAFVQVWESPQFWFLGPARLFGQSALPDVLSISYQECERDLLGDRAYLFAPSGVRLFDSAVVRIGLAGVGTYVAAGDTGSQCSNARGPAIGWPASSSFVTTVGGTRLVVDQSNERTDEVTWNDLDWLTLANGGGAGGGGYSQFYPRPFFQSRSATSNRNGARRMIPDVSAHSSGLPGWPINLDSSWSSGAGTSAATPLVAAAMAIISGNERSQGRPPLGPAAPLFYSLGSGQGSPFFDVVKGNNQFAKRIAGWQARPGYDLATGLGVPLFEAIPGLLPARG